MEGKHRIYFVRHGQCRGNVSGETLSPEDDVITDFGRKQAATLGDHLKDVKFTRAFSSNYQRAFETAREIMQKNFNPTEIQQDKRIREREMGNLVGLPSTMVVQRTLQKLAAGTRINDIEMEDAETAAEFVERVHNFFKDLFQSLKSSSSPETILVVSHGLTMRRFLCGLNDNSFPGLCTVTNWDTKCRAVTDNTSCTIFTIDWRTELDDEKPFLTFHQIYDREHLKKLASETDGVEGHKKDGKTLGMDKAELMTLIQEALKYPGAKEELSGCIQM